MPDTTTIERDVPNRGVTNGMKRVTGNWTREALREYAFLHQFDQTAAIALNASSERRATVMFLEIARNALYPDMGPTQLYKLLRYRWRRYCKTRKRCGHWTLSRNYRDPLWRDEVDE